jgi:hypothetical protein
MNTLKQDLASALAENEALKAKLADKRKVWVKHNPETGTVNVYGLRARFPVSMYPGEWAVVFAQRDAIEAACKVASPIADAHRRTKASTS